MARRKPYTKVEKSNQIRPEHVRGMGDIVFKGFQCLNPHCDAFIFFRKDELNEFFELLCERCGHVHRFGEDEVFYDYKLKNTESDEVLEEGTFSILHDDYVNEAKDYKYCIICCTLKPLDQFDKHNTRRSKRQGECRLCKAVYNSLKNPTRTRDQHREAAQKRRLYVELAGGGRIDSSEVYRRFSYKCFKCGADLSQDIQGNSVLRGNLDHTLPAKFLWPLTTENATLLCQEHNMEKSDKWPSEFYGNLAIRHLVTRTGIPYKTLAGEPHYNPDALERLRDPEFVDELLTKFAPYMDEMIMIRNRILEATDFDMFDGQTTLAEYWIQKANERLTN